MDLEPDSFRVSTWPRRTRVENSSPSRTTHSAAVAPPFMARATMSVAMVWRSVEAGFSVVMVILKFQSNPEAWQKHLEWPLMLRGCKGAFDSAVALNLLEQLSAQDDTDPEVEVPQGLKPQFF